MCYYRYILLILFYSCQDLIQGQTYNLRGISSYGIKGKGFSFSCQLPADAKVPFFLRFEKSDVEVCRVDPDNCSYRDMTDNRYTCGCINKNKKLYYMNISSLSLSDEGKWKCREDVNNKGESNSISLPVYYGPENVIISPRPVQVVENMSSEVDCKSDCKPNCSITWYKGSGTTGIILQSNNGRLMLNNIKRKDATYTCQAYHTVLPPSSKTLQITVFYGPDYINVQPQFITVVENSTVNITCSSDCNPSCTYKWYKEPSPTESNDNGLLLTNIKRYQDGNYTCRVSNSKIPGLSKTRTASITVNYPPTINIIKSDSTTNTEDEGSRVVFSCSVDSRPSSVITWSRSEGRQLSTTDKYILTNATCQHTDNYTCKANNVIGLSVSRTIPLYVKCSPRENTPTITRIVNKVNSTVNLKLNITAYPKPSFNWIFSKTLQAVMSTSEEISVNKFYSKLQLKLNESMFGDYIVTVNNSVGSANFTFTIVNGEPPKKIDKQSQTRMIIGSTVSVCLIVIVIIIVVVVARLFLQRRSKEKEGGSIPLESGNGGQALNNTIIVNENSAYVSGDELFQEKKTNVKSVEGVLEETKSERSDSQFGARERGIFSKGAASDLSGHNVTVDKSKQKEKKQGKFWPQKGKRSKKQQEEVYVNSDVTMKEKKGIINKESLIYADVDFSDFKVTKKPVIRIEEEVEYAQIQPGVRGPTPPPIDDSDSEEDAENKN